MLNKVDKVFVGKDVIGGALAGADMTALQAAILEGEITVLDKDYKVAAATETFATSPVIYLAEGSSEIFNSVNPDGTALSGRRVLISGAIDGRRVVNYLGSAHSPKVEAVATLPAIADTIIPGTEYVLRIVFKGDIATQVPGQNIQTARYIARTGDTSSEVYDGLVSEINSRYAKPRFKGAQAVVSAANNAGSLAITALPVASCTTSVNDIDELVMNSFDVYLNYVDNDYRQSEVALSGAKVITNADRGVGTWETVRDVEKHAQSYEGVTNRVWFPVIKPAMRTVKGTEYNLVTIEHDRQYRSSDNEYNKETSLVELIALAPELVGTVETNVLATLNSWMGSLPNSFESVSF